MWETQLMTGSFEDQDPLTFRISQKARDGRISCMRLQTVLRVRLSSRKAA
jgi:hypothetical protein